MQTRWACYATAVNEVERAIVEAQIGRALRANSRVVSRCALRLPVVMTVPPVLEDGAPFPTHFWLTCPLAHKRIARLEAAGGVREWEARIATDRELAEAMRRAHASYRASRGGEHEGGIAGIRGEGLKCLHAHFAHHRAGADNPVGAGVATQVEPLDCTTACVVNGQRDPEWREPENGRARSGD